MAEQKDSNKPGLWGQHNQSYHNLRLCMNRVFPQNPYVDALPPRVMVFRGRV